jgi:hypothetical protein
MLLNRKNLLTELTQLTRKSISEDELLAEVKHILDENETKRVEIKSSLYLKTSTNHNAFIFDKLETEKIFHLTQIKSLCIDYRLRFLDSHLFKGAIPEEAISIIHQLEKEHAIKIEGFRIMAPSKLFKLENYDDPLLFAPIGNGYYYLIHKWGNDIHPLRKIAMKPFKSIGNFIVLLVVISLLLTALLPQNLFGKSPHSVMSLVTFLFMLKSVMGIALYYCFWQGKNFNEDIWLSKYYN